MKTKIQTKIEEIEKGCRIIFTRKKYSGICGENRNPNKTLYCKVCESKLQSLKEGYYLAMEEVFEKINLANIEISNYFCGEVCDKCNSHIEPAIHHYIDHFYKKIINEIKSLQVDEK